MARNLLSRMIYVKKVKFFLFCLNFFIMHLDGQGTQRTQFRHHDTYQKPIKVPFDRVPPMRNHTPFNHMQKPHISTPIHKFEKPIHNSGYSPYYQGQKNIKELVNEYYVAHHCPVYLDMSTRLWAFENKSSQDDIVKFWQQQIEKEQKERTAFLKLHDYSFQPSVTLQKELQDLKAAIHKEEQIAAQRTLLQTSWHYFSLNFYTEQHVLTKNELDKKIMKEQHAWEEESLKKIEQDDKKIAQYLASHNLFFKPSDKAAQNLNKVESDIKAQDESWMYWISDTMLPKSPTYIDPKIQIRKDALFVIEQEKVAWQKKALEKIEVEQAKILSIDRHKAFMAEQKIQDAVHAQYKKLQAAILEEEEKKIQDIESIQFADKKAWIQKFSQLTEQMTHLQEDLMKAEKKSKKIACQDIRQALIVAAITSKYPFDIEHIFIHEDCYEDVIHSGNAHDENKLYKSSDVKTTPNFSSASSPDFDHKLPYKSGNITSYQGQDVVYEGQQCIQIIYVDSHTNKITGSCLIPRDGSTPMMIALPVPVAKENENIASLQKMIQQHQAFTDQARNRANRLDYKAQIQSIRARFVTGYISAEQAYALENQIHHKQVSIQAQKDIKDAYDAAKRQEKIDKKLEKIHQPSRVKQAFQALFGKKEQEKSSKDRSVSVDQDQQNKPVHVHLHAQDSALLTHDSGIDKTPLLSTATDNVPSDKGQSIGFVEPVDESSAKVHQHHDQDDVVGQQDTMSPAVSHYPVGSQSDKDGFIQHFLKYFNTPSGEQTVHSESNIAKVESDASCSKKSVAQDIDDEKQSLREQLITAQKIWSDTQNVTHVTDAEKSSIFRMQDCIVQPKNAIAADFAYASLQDWQDAQIAPTDDIYQYHAARSKKFHDFALSKNQIGIIDKPAQELQKVDLEKMIERYQKIEQSHLTENYDPALQSDTDFNHQYTTCIATRLQALQQSQEQIASKNFVGQSHTMSPQARGFMMAHNMNHRIFDAQQPTAIQHCLTKELIGVVEQSASMAFNQKNDSTIYQFAQQTCQLAVGAQQLNQTGHIEQAVAVTDLSQFFAMYGKSMLEDNGASDAPGFMAMGQGVSRAAEKWGTFLNNLRKDPNQTIGKIAGDCHNIGKIMYKMAQVAYEFTPEAYMQDVRDLVADRIKQPDHGNVLDDVTMLAGKRMQRNMTTLRNAYDQSLQAAQIVVQDMKNKTAEENIADITEVIADGLITDRIMHTLGKICTLVGEQALQAADSLMNQIPSRLHDSALHTVQTSAGTFELFADATGEGIAVASAAHIQAENITKLAALTTKTKTMIDRILAITQPDVAKIKAFDESIAPYLNSEKLLNVERLKSIEGIEQIDNFKKYTKDFTDLSKLKSEEILYLNLCDWLEPQATKINNRLQALGGITIIDPQTGVQATIEKYDIFHSLLGEMKPGSIRDHTKGGHLMIPELKAALLDIGDITPIKNGFFDMYIEYAGKGAQNYKANTFFPLGTSVDQAVAMIEDAINHSKYINFTESNGITRFSCDVINLSDEIFGFRIENKIATIYPVNPAARMK